MVLRWNAENKSVFLGCECYPDCDETMTLFEWEEYMLDTLKVQAKLGEIARSQPTMEELNRLLEALEKEIEPNGRKGTENE